MINFSYRTILSVTLLQHMSLFHQVNHPLPTLQLLRKKSHVHGMELLNFTATLHHSLHMLSLKWILHSFQSMFYVSISSLFPTQDQTSVHVLAKGHTISLSNQTEHGPDVGILPKPDGIKKFFLWCVVPEPNPKQMHGCFISKQH